MNTAFTFVTTHTGYCKRCRKTGIGLLSNGLCRRCDDALFGKNSKEEKKNEIQTN